MCLQVMAIFVVAKKRQVVSAGDFRKEMKKHHIFTIVLFALILFSPYTKADAYPAGRRLGLAHQLQHQRALVQVQRQRLLLSRKRGVEKTRLGVHVNINYVKAFHRNWANVGTIHKYSYHGGSNYTLVKTIDASIPLKSKGVRFTKMSDTEASLQRRRQQRILLCRKRYRLHPLRRFQHTRQADRGEPQRRTHLLALVARGADGSQQQHGG